MTRGSTYFAVALAAALAVAVPQAAVALGDTKVEAGSCSIANSGTASGDTVTCNYGLTPEQLKQVTEAAVKGATGPLVDRIVDISKTLGVTEDAAKTLLKIVGEDPNIPGDKLADALTKVAGDYKRLRAQAAALNPENPTARKLIEEAKPEIDAGHFQRARELLRQATQAQVAAAQEARTLKGQAQAADDAEMLGAASSTSAEVDVELTQRHYVQAAVFGQAAEYVPSGHTSERGGYLVRQADALYRQGDERGDNAALRSSIEVYKAALVGYLEDAVTAYRAALEERTRERVPLEWAGTQTMLGTALLSLSWAESGTTRLTETIADYRSALEEQTPDRTPVDWAVTQDRLGRALVALGTRESGTAHMEEGIACYRSALEIPALERVRGTWAIIQDDLAGALVALGSRESSAVHLEEAIAHYRAVLRVQTREREPPYWASTQNSLGGALLALGKRESGTARLEEAVVAFRAAMEEQTPGRVPRDWAGSFGNQGVALMLIADRKNDFVGAETALRQIETAYETARSSGDEQRSAYFQKELAQANAIRERLKGQ